MNFKQVEEEFWQLLGGKEYLAFAAGARRFSCGWMLTANYVIMYPSFCIFKGRMSTGITFDVYTEKRRFKNLQKMSISNIYIRKRFLGVIQTSYVDVPCITAAVEYGFDNNVDANGLHAPFLRKLLLKHASVDIDPFGRP